MSLARDEEQGEGLKMLPKKVNVLSVTYSIKYCDTLAEVSRDQMNLNWGQCDHMRNEIRVFRYPSDQATLQTLFHEILHIYEYSFGLSLEESLVNWIAAHFLDFVVRNKVDKWITEQK